MSPISSECVTSPRPQSCPVWYLCTFSRAIPICQSDCPETYYRNPHSVSLFQTQAQRSHLLRIQCPPHLYKIHVFEPAMSKLTPPSSTWHSLRHVPQGFQRGVVSWRKTEEKVFKSRSAGWCCRALLRYQTPAEQSHSLKHERAKRHEVCRPSRTSIGRDDDT